MKNIFETMQWIREPGNVVYRDETMEVTTKPHTDLWQNTYYHFCNDNAPVCVMDIEDSYFTMTVKTDFDSAHHRFDQCGVVIYQDTENWLKASCEYENETFSNLGSVVTNHGYSDWAVTEISPENKTIWYRLSRREDTYRIEYSFDGIVSLKCDQDTTHGNILKKQSQSQCRKQEYYVKLPVLSDIH